MDYLIIALTLLPTVKEDTMKVKGTLPPGKTHPINKLGINN